MSELHRLLLFKVENHLAFTITYLRHNLKSRLFETAGHHSSSDTVGEERRALMKELVNESNPFNMDRPPVVHVSAKSATGSPFGSLSKAVMEDFVSAVRDDFQLLYPDLCPMPPCPE